MQLNVVTPRLKKKPWPPFLEWKSFTSSCTGRGFNTIQTDHKNLEGLLSERKEIPQRGSPRVHWWALTLAAYEYKTAFKVVTRNAQCGCVKLSFNIV